MIREGKRRIRNSIPFWHKRPAKVWHRMCSWNLLLPQLLDLNLLIHLHKNTSHHGLITPSKMNSQQNSFRWIIDSKPSAVFPFPDSLPPWSYCAQRPAGWKTAGAWPSGTRRRRASIAMDNLLGYRTWHDWPHALRCAAQDRSVQWVPLLEVSRGSAQGSEKG